MNQQPVSIEYDEVRRVRADFVNENGTECDAEVVVNRCADRFTVDLPGSIFCVNRQEAVILIQLLTAALQMRDRLEK